MNLEKLSQKIIDKIKKEKITPKSRWNFLLKDYFFWGVYVFTLLVGAAAFAVVIFLIVNNSSDFMDVDASTFGEHVLLSLPYLWIVFIGVFVILALYNFKYTDKGYKLNPVYLIILSILISLVLGAVFFAMGGGEKIENILTEKVHIYEKFRNYRDKQVWHRPERGILMGQIIEIENHEIFELQDLFGEEWKVELLEGATVRGELRPGIHAKVFGEQVGKEQFEAYHVGIPKIQKLHKIPPPMKGMK